MDWENEYCFKNSRILNYFDFHLECSIDIAFKWDIPELPIRYNGETIKKKTCFGTSRLQQPYIGQFPIEKETQILY